MRNWAEQDGVDSGWLPPCTTTEESAQLKTLKKVNAELKWANDIAHARSATTTSKSVRTGRPGWARARTVNCSLRLTSRRTMTADLSAMYPHDTEGQAMLRPLTRQRGRLGVRAGPSRR
ncbi:hypothetical protein [Streptomyces sp. NBC_01013]|uniref:hypothetical protein n=1 Tax=Streptomyces sp. NBC_01013 TaxID=2903718 RepID=UPI003867DB2D